MLILQELAGYCLIGLAFMVCLGIFWLPVFLLMKKRISFWKQAAYFLFTGCVLVILAATVLDVVLLGVLGAEDILAAERLINIVPFRVFTETWVMGGNKQMTQVIANILMFVPLGFVAPAAFPKIRSWWKTALLSALFSFSIEFVQYFIGRCADVDDWMLNTAGGIVGYAIFSLVFKMWKKWKSGLHGKSERVVCTEEMKR